MLFIHENTVERRIYRIKKDSFKKLREMGEDNNETIFTDKFWITRYKNRNNETNFESSGEHTKVQGFMK